MNRYEAKQQRRRERLEQRAARIETEGASAHARARAMADAIPFGQPILIGHHSEKRDRNYRAKIVGTFRKAFELNDQAKVLRARAAAVGSAGVSSDDPDALAKLQAKLEKLEGRQALMRDANAAIRSGDHDELGRLGLSASVVAGLLTPDYLGRIGFPDYALKNNGAEIRRLKKRIAHLEAVAAAETKTVELPGGIRIVENTEANRLQIFFPGKPDDAMRARLKAHSFRWAPSEGAWQRHLGNGARWAAYAALGISHA